MRTTRILLIAGVSAAIGCTCSPFFPDTGEPVSVPSGRTTPGGVVRQLISAYTNRSIGLYEDLFPTDGSFRFYISPRLVETGTTGMVNVVAEQIDTQFAYVAQGTYYYWTYEDERRSHDNLFRGTTSISFTLQPLYDPAEYVYHMTDGGDTAGVEVKMVGGVFVLYFPDDDNPLVQYEQEVVIERQIFYMVRDADRNWVIKKWFDFGTTG